MRECVDGLPSAGINGAQMRPGRIEYIGFAAIVGRHHILRPNLKTDSAASAELVEWGGPCLGDVHRTIGGNREPRYLTERHVRGGSTVLKVARIIERTAATTGDCCDETIRVDFANLRFTPEIHATVVA